MDYRLARFLRIVIYILLGLLCLFILYVGYRGIKNTIKSSTSSTEPAKPAKLSDSQTNGAQMRYVITGPVVANQNFRKTTIIVSASQAVVEVAKGYESAPSLSQAFANNQTAYNTFLSALNVAGFTSTKAAISGASREGSCALGNKYSYQIYVNGAFTQDTWNTSCDSRTGTFNGATSRVQTLFQAQIPNYNSIVSSVQ
jgi:hypothetical protein